MKPEIIADWWYCGDECNCSYPRIRKLVPPAHDIGGGMLVYSEGSRMLEEGPWRSYGDGEETTREQWEWMLEKAREYKVDNLAEIEEEAKAYIDLT